jgi:hypothetical protein
MPLYGTGWPLLAPDGTAAAPSYGFGSVPSTGFYASGGAVRMSSSGTLSFQFSAGVLDLLSQNALLRFGIAQDCTLARDGASNTIAMRNLANAQTFRVYNTYTDSSNYERGVFQWSSNVLLIGTEAGGTGLTRAVRFVTGGTARWEIGTTGLLFPTTSGTLDLGATTNLVRNGFFGGYVRLLGVATGSLPAAATAGAGALIYDTTVNKLKMSNGTTWETITSV